MRVVEPAAIPPRKAFSEENLRPKIDVRGIETAAQARLSDAVWEILYACPH